LILPAVRPDDILDFWFLAGPEKWWVRDTGFDAAITERFSEIHARASHGDLDDWAGEETSALALVIVLDQFSRNLFRDDARTFAQDATARGIALQAIDAGFDCTVAGDRRQFFYLPFMHAEDLAAQDYCVAQYQLLGDVNSLDFAELHRDIIRRFRRFPHRNRVLGRLTSPAEQAFLDSGGFAG
jgi:uncharacterized protein (DUF924 family)